MCLCFTPTNVAQPQYQKKLLHYLKKKQNAGICKPVLTYIYWLLNALILNFMPDSTGWGCILCFIMHHKFSIFNSEAVVRQQNVASSSCWNKQVCPWKKKKKKKTESGWQRTLFQNLCVPFGINDAITEAVNFALVPVWMVLFLFSMRDTKCGLNNKYIVFVLFLCPKGLGNDHFLIL